MGAVLLLPGVADIALLWAGNAYPARPLAPGLVLVSNSHFGFCGLVVGWVNDGHQGGAARPSRWKRRRFCKGEGEQRILPRREDQIDRDRRQLAEEIAA